MILNYGITRHSNAILEHVKLKISISKNRARGSKKMIYLGCCDLESPTVGIMS